MPRWRRCILLAVGLVVVGISSWGGVALGQPSQASSPLKVNIAASVDGDLVTYIFTVENTGSSNVAHVFMAGSVPAGAEFVRQVATPPGAWFRGFEGAGTSIQSTVWLTDGIPANGRLGPFIYQVRKGKATDLSAHGWVHWLKPSDGVAMSAPLNPGAGPLLGMSPGGSYHDTHATKLGLQCTACHATTKVDDYDDPLAQTFFQADKKVCLSCHSSARTFYGDDWKETAVSK